ncbi:MAG: lipopolysaccharide kinase InaA family protein [Breznakibacter sp.]
MSVNPDFESIRPYTARLSALFPQLGLEVKTGRNSVRIATVDDERVAIKSYERMTWANRYVYGLFRKSKAQRAYENALVLLNCQISTPAPIAFVDYVRNGKLIKSYFVSKYVPFKSAKELFSGSIEDCRVALISFAKFVHKLHTQGIYHNDFNLSNIFYSLNGSSFEFSLIDNNRMNFRKPFEAQSGT